MSKEELLIKCIGKAVEGGWDCSKAINPKLSCNLKRHLHDIARIVFNRLSENDILFDQSFCKAFFGEKLVCEYCGCPVDYCNCNCDYIPAYQYHGQKMFLAPDRLEYLKQFLGEKV